MSAWRRGTVWLIGALVGCLAAVTAAGAQGQAPEGGMLNLDLEVLAPPGELNGPVDIAHAGDERLFMVERGGTIRVVRPDGFVEPVPFLDITANVLSGGERGLLGLAFHPNYKENGAFFVNYTAQPDGTTRISRFQVSADRDAANPNSEEIILTVAQPFANHNAGDLLFGPHDGYLYIPLGDGGGGNDPQNRAQNMELLLGKLLRIDVDGGPGLAPDCGEPGLYTIPADNPFVNAERACDEIWALGLRNPWRASFDRQTGDLYIGDVGQFFWEEIDFQPASSGGGENYGWSCFEGAHVNEDTNMPACQGAAAYAMPIFELGHAADGVCAITGGFVYRGWRYPDMVGRYFFTDLCATSLWDLQNVGGAWQGTRHDYIPSLERNIVTFGEDVQGELYLARISDGTVYRLVEDTPATGGDVAAWLPAFLK